MLGVAAAIKPEWIEGISKCIESLGTPEFDASYFRMINDVIAIEQCTIFTFETIDQVNCVMAMHAGSQSLANELANDYTSGQYKHDPNRSRIKDSLESHEDNVFGLKFDSPDIPVDYKEHFFNTPHLRDKLSITCTRGNLCYYINLYKSKNSNTLIEEDIKQIESTAPIIASLAVKGFGSSDRDNNKTLPVQVKLLESLSKRERQVCEHILKGYSLKVIACELGVSETSAATYRRRAYDKLGIHSKGKLVALCNTQVS